MRVTKKSVVLLLAFSVFGAEMCTAQIREVRTVLLGDVGAARVDRRGNATVYINPRRCRQLGPELCEYFRNHEYGHIHLNHFRRNISVQQAEAEADRYAARTSSPSASRAAYNWFSAGNGSSRLHGSSSDRARRVAGTSYVSNRGPYQSQYRNSYRSPRTMSAGARPTVQVRTTPYSVRPSSRQRSCGCNTIPIRNSYAR